MMCESIRKIIFKASNSVPQNLFAVLIYIYTKICALENLSLDIKFINIWNPNENLTGALHMSA